MEVNVCRSWPGDLAGTADVAWPFACASGVPGVLLVFVTCTALGLLAWYGVSVFDMYVYTRVWAWVVGSCARGMFCVGGGMFVGGSGMGVRGAWV